MKKPQEGKKKYYLKIKTTKQKNILKIDNKNAGIAGEDSTGSHAYSEFLRDGSCFCSECWTFYKSSLLALFVAMDSSIQPNARVGKTCLFEELSAMHMRRSVQPERRVLQKHIFGERILQLQT